MSPAKLISPFTGPLTPTAIEAFLGQCEDAFEIYAATKSATSPELSASTKIRMAGIQMQEPAMSAWWSAGRTEFLKLGTWKEFDKQIRGRFMPKGYKLMALRTFFCCSQGGLSFLDYAASLAEARNAVWWVFNHRNHLQMPVSYPTLILSLSPSIIWLQA